MKTRYFSMMLMILFLGTTGVTAQDRQAHKEQMKAAREAVKAYMDDNVLPVVKEQRKSLDAQLSTADKEEVEAIRTELASMREGRKSKMEEMKEKRQQQEGQGRPSFSEEEREAMRAERMEQGKAMRKLMTRAWNVVDKNEEAIEGLLADLEDEKELWQVEIKEIVSDLAPKRDSLKGRGMRGQRGPRPEGMGRGNRNNTGQMRGPGRGRGGEMGMMGPGGRRGPGGILSELASPVRFLLMDPDKETEIQGQGLEIFPNPSFDVNTLVFDVAEKGKVDIQLMDQQGKPVLKVLNEELGAGTYTEFVDVTGLEKGFYFYRIQTSEGVATQKLLVE